MIKIDIENDPDKRRLLYIGIFLDEIMKNLVPIRSRKSFKHKHYKGEINYSSTNRRNN